MRLESGHGVSTREQRGRRSVGPQPRARRTTKELCTSVSSRSSTRHFRLACSGRNGARRTSSGGVCRAACVGCGAINAARACEQSASRPIPARRRPTYEDGALAEGRRGHPCRGELVHRLLLGLHAGKQARQERRAPSLPFRCGPTEHGPTERTQSNG